LITLQDIAFRGHSPDGPEVVVDDAEFPTVRSRNRKIEADFEVKMRNENAKRGFA